MNEAGRAYCKATLETCFAQGARQCILQLVQVVNKGFDAPTPNAVIAEGQQHIIVYAVRTISV